MKIRSLGSRLALLETRTAVPAAKVAEPFYLSPEWRTLIARLIEDRGRICQECGRRDCRIFGDHVTELKDGGAPLDPRNVKLLCGSCHTKKTAAVRAARLRTKHLRPDSEDRLSASTLGRPRSEDIDDFDVTGTGEGGREG